MNKAANRTYLWADLQSTTKSSEVSSHFTRLNQMAVAYSTIGSPLYHLPNLKNDIISGLDWAYANRYRESKSEYDNWWDWEIGTPQLVNSTLVLMYEDLTQTQIDNYMRAIDRFVPNPSKRTASSVVETGANLLDKAYVVSLRGVIGKSSAKITQGKDSMSPAFLYVKAETVLRGWIVYSAYLCCLHRRIWGRAARKNGGSDVLIERIFLAYHRSERS